MNVKKLLIERAKKNKKKIIFPEAGFSDRIVEAGLKIAKDGIADVIFVGDESSISLRVKNKDLSKFKIYNPKTCDFMDKLVEHLVSKRSHKGVNAEIAREMLSDPIYFATALTDLGYADGMVCGAEVSTARSLRPALEIIKSKEGIVSSYFLFYGKNKIAPRLFMMGDCAIVQNPTFEQLTVIAELMIDESKELNLFNPKVAFLSYSTCGSAESESTLKVKEAYKLFSERNKDIISVGEVQLDTAISKDVARVKLPDSDFVPPANIFVVPNLDSGNLCYKAIEYFGGYKAIGPISMGFNKPVNDLSRGCSVEDIILVTALTVLQCK